VISPAVPAATLPLLAWRLRSVLRQASRLLDRRVA